MALTQSQKVEIDSSAPDFNLPATNGQNYSLDSFKNAHALVIVFTCNHCPYAKAAWPLLVKLAQEFKEKGVAFVAINPNDDKQYPEDSLEKMKEHHSARKMNFPYLIDESQDTARAYGAQCTPDIFVYDRERKLRYHGRVDDNWQHPEAVKKEELKEAIEALLRGESPSGDQNPSMGCSIKWRQ